MNKPTAFEKMRKHKAAREKRQADTKAYYEHLARTSEQRRMAREQGGRDLKRELAEIERQGDEMMKKIMYDCGMSMWGADLQACLLGPVAMPVPMPPVYGGEPYKMMVIPRPTAKDAR